MAQFILGFLLGIIATFVGGAVLLWIGSRISNKFERYRRDQFYFDDEESWS